MVGSFDYNNSDVMDILNNPNLSDEQKKKLFEKYKSDLKETRRKEIITKWKEPIFVNGDDDNKNDYR